MRGERVAGRYRLDEQVGSGGMGVVWRATDEELGRVVALKRAHIANGDSSVREMRREARLAAGVHHPNVVTLFDLVTDGAERWLVMEYLPSRSLADIIRDQGSLPVSQVARIGAQLAAALHAVHARGLVHRDIKPGNALVTADGTAKLTDFGVSRVVWGEATLADTPMIAGTPAYLAPEVANGNAPTQASDVFSLGATLYAAVEGSSPFGTADNSLAMLRRAAAGVVTAPRRAGALAPVLSGVLNRDPAKRPDTERLRQKLTEIAETDTDATVPVLDDTLPWHQRLPRRAAVLAGVSVAALTAGVVALVAFSVTSTSGSPATSQGNGGSAIGVGNPRTVDPCGLMDAAALARFGEPDLQTDYGNFNRCDVLVTSARGSKVDVLVELQAKDETPELSAGRRTKSGAMTVVEFPSEGDACQRLVPLADGNSVAITAKRASDGPLADYCTMASVAATSVTRVLNRDGMPRRQAPLPVGSLAYLNACALLDGKALSHVPGNDATRTGIGFGGWRCDWDSDASDIGVSLIFTRNVRLVPGQDGQLTRLSGRQAFVQPNGDDPGTCVVDVVHRPYVSVMNGDSEELVTLIVRGSQPVRQLCSVATGLAGAAAARLPAV